MKLMLCVHKEEAQNLIQRIKAVNNSLDVNVCNLEELLQLPSLFAYDALFIAIDGAAGMEAVIDTKERDPTIPLIWMSEDRMFSTVAYNLKVAWFLKKNCTEKEIAEALQDARQGRRQPYAYCTVL